MPRGGGQRGQRRYDADCDRGDPPAFSDALEHGNPFVGLYVTIKYLHAGFEESVAQHCQMDAIKRRSLCRVLPESVSQNTGSERDTVSPTGLFRKLRPGISAQNGMRGTKQGSTGNYVPVCGLKTGCSFRLINPHCHRVVQRLASSASFT